MSLGGMVRKSTEKWYALEGGELQVFAEKALINASNIVGTFYPTERVADGYLIEFPAEHEHLPPTHLRHNYGFKDGKWSDDLYLQSGKIDTDSMRRLLDSDRFALGQAPILEFGCSSGRLLRHLIDLTEKTECWGADIHAEAIHWAQAHLSPPFHFVLTSTAPHLPFEDCTFDFVFAGSVFTHIGEMDDSWLLELRRITRRGGRIYVTITDEKTLEVIRTKYPQHPSNQHVADFNVATRVLERPFLQFVTRATPWLQRSIYCRDRWLGKVGRWFQIRAVKEQAYGWQTGVLLAKPT
jgi:ubiquinone/menaquinone biosynthesis C-methylase UbiE